MATEPLKSSILSLSDLELATLLCLTSAQHALVSTPTAHLSDLESELRLIATHVFGLSVAAVTCDAESDAQDFLEDVVGVHVGRETRRRGRGERGEEGGLPRLPNVLLLSGLWRASRAVQVQVLEV